MEDKQAQTFPQRLVAERKRNGYSSQKAFAEALGVSPVTINFYERGERTPDYEMFARIAEFLGVSYDYMLGKSKFRTSEDKRSIQKKTNTLQSAISSSDVDRACDIVELLRLILETSEKNDVAAITLPAVAQILADILDILAAYAEKSAINPAALLIYEQFNHALKNAMAANSTQAAEPFGIKTPLESWLRDFTITALPHCKDIQQNTDNFVSALQKTLFDTAKASSDTTIADIEERFTKGGGGNA